MIKRVRHPKSFDIDTIKNDLIDLYVNKGWPIIALSKKFHLGSPKILAGLQKWGIQKRSRSDILKFTFDERRKSRSCVSCSEQFRGTYNQKFCQNCVNSSSKSGLLRLSSYAMNENQFNEMLNQQQGKCVLCQRPFSDIKTPKSKSSSIVVDHDHKTREVRGLLCSGCNISLGHIEKKSSEWLRNVIRYAKVEL